jgi:hypothetical protein
LRWWRVREEDGPEWRDELRAEGWEAEERGG